MAASINININNLKNSYIWYSSAMQNGTPPSVATFWMRCAHHSATITLYYYPTNQYLEAKFFQVRKLLGHTPRLQRCSQERLGCSNRPPWAVSCPVPQTAYYFTKAESMEQGNYLGRQKSYLHGARGDPKAQYCPRKQKTNVAELLLRAKLKKKLLGLAVVERAIGVNKPRDCLPSSWVTLTQKFPTIK